MWRYRYTNVYDQLYCLIIAILTIGLCTILSVQPTNGQALIHPNDTLMVGVQDTLTYGVSDTDDTTISASYFKFTYNADVVRIDSVYSELDWRIVGKDTGTGVLEIATLSARVRAFDGDFFSIVLTPIAEGVTGLQVVDLSWTDCKDILDAPVLERPTNPPPESVAALYPGTTYWVDAVVGNDGNDCSNFDTPCLTTRPIDSELTPGDAVIFMGGVHRLGVKPVRSGSPSNYITYTSYPGMEAVISGASVYTRQWVSNGDGTWTVPYTQSLPEHPAIAHPQVQHRPEMLIVDGAVYETVYNLADVSQGSFFVQGPSSSPVSITAGFLDDPNSMTIEVATEDSLFVPPSSVDYLHIDKLIFKHAGNSFGNMGCLQADGKGWLVTEVLVVECNTTGIRILGSGHYFTDTHAWDNGMIGWNAMSASHVTVENGTAFRNNTKGFEPNWHAGGFKLTHGSSWFIIDGFEAVDNDGPGVWFDIPWNEHNLIVNSRFISNTMAGVMLEHGTIYSVVKNNIIYGTRKYNGVGVGVRIQSASDNLIENNTIYGNTGDGVRQNYRDRRSPTGHNLFVRNIIGYNGTSPSNDYEFLIQQESNEKIVEHFQDNIFVMQVGSNLTWRVEGVWEGHDITKWLQQQLHSSPYDMLVSRENQILENPNNPDGWRSLIEGYGADQE